MKTLRRAKSVLFRWLLRTRLGKRLSDRIVSHFFEGFGD